MAADIAISLENISKSYKRYAHPADRLKELLLPGRSYSQEFWALQDVSFEVNRGETVGIIGRNGAGKSTLLQIICGTLTPTSGSIHVGGRVAALLELGAGFNPEFTGRENVYMNGAIIGFSKREVDERLDNIIAFADIGDFIDQPVKTYSSGMYVRLAFASAIHVDPDILIVDEALAVGDMFFQAKCMSRMRQMMDTGVTVLFVSHELNAVKSFCQKCVWLEDGKVRKAGDTEEITIEYAKSWVESINSNNSATKSHTANLHLSADTEIAARFLNVPEFSPDVQLFRTGTGAARFRGAEVLDINEQPLNYRLEFNQRMIIRAYVEFWQDCRNIAIGYHIRNRQGQEIIGNDSFLAQTDIYEREWRQGDRLIIDFFAQLPVINGVYNINLFVSSFTDLKTFSDVVFLDWVENAYVFEMNQRRPFPIFDLVYLDDKIAYEVV